MGYVSEYESKKINAIFDGCFDLKIQHMLNT